MVFSGSDVDFRPALLVSSQNGEVRTVDASVASSVGSHGNLDTTCTSPRTWQSLAPCLCVVVKFFILCQTQVGGGVSGSLDSQVTRHRGSRHRGIFRTPPSGVESCTMTVPMLSP